MACRCWPPTVCSLHGGGLWVSWRWNLHGGGLWVSWRRWCGGWCSPCGSVLCSWPGPPHAALDPEGPSLHHRQEDPKSENDHHKGQPAVDTKEACECDGCHRWARTPTAPAQMPCAVHTYCPCRALVSTLPPSPCRWPYCFVLLTLACPALPYGVLPDPLPNKIDNFL